MINPDLERFTAAHIPSTTVEIRSSRGSPASHPRQVAGQILAAAEVGARDALDARRDGKGVPYGFDLDVDDENVENN